MHAGISKASIIPPPLPLILETTLSAEATPAQVLSTRGFSNVVKNVLTVRFFSSADIIDEESI